MTLFSTGVCEGPLLFFLTGLCVISLPRQRVIQNVIHHIQQIRQNTIALFKTEKLTTNVNWTLVEQKTKIEYAIPVSSYLAKNNLPFPPLICLSHLSL